MGRSQETSGKKEVRTRKEKKRKEKLQKREKKKNEGKSSFDDMIAYVDEFGMITSTPPDPSKKVVIDAGSIEIKTTRNKPEQPKSFLRKGVVTFYNSSKGFGFIRDLDSNERVFVHTSNLLDPIQENSVVLFEISKGARGTLAASKVRLFTENQE
ncbi:MAG TPA: cold shock domain-containing protein [Bacteroidales bacterium]|nr:cold shock domain-containing protein [Bacteroidales bacterium]